MAKETFTALEGSLLIGTTGYAEVRRLEANIPDMQNLTEVRTWGNQVYVKREKPESVADGKATFVFDNMGIIYALASPTMNDVKGPVGPIDYIWKNSGTGSWFRLRFASVYPGTVGFTQERDGHLEGTFDFKCAKSDVVPFYGATLT